MKRLDKRALTIILLVLIPTMLLMLPKANALPTPTTFSSGGYTWYKWNNPSATKAVIVYYGGTITCSGGTSGTAHPESYDSKPSNEKAWVSELYDFGFTVVAPQSTNVIYQCTGTSSSTCSSWPHTLRNTVAGWGLHVEVFGHSAGGLVVGSEIIRYSDYYSAAFVSAPVNYDSFCSAFLFQSAHSAGSMKTTLRLEYGSGDPYGIAAQMDLYRTNAYYYSGHIVLWDYIGGNMHNIFFTDQGSTYRAYVKTHFWQYG
jgi:hypothetical protein